MHYENPRQSWANGHGIGALQSLFFKTGRMFFTFDGRKLVRSVGREPGIVIRVCLSRLSRSGREAMQRRGDVQTVVVPAAWQRRASLGPDLRAVRRARGRSDRQRESECGVAAMVSSPASGEHHSVGSVRRTRHTVCICILLCWS